MRFRLIIWLVIFSLGLLVGDRYGLPGWAQAVGDKGFGAVEAWAAKLRQPVPAMDEAKTPNEPASEDPGVTPEASPAPEPVEPQAQTGASGDLGHPANAGLRMNDAGLKIIEESEDLRLEAYSAGGQWFIGYGHSRTAEAGMTVTASEAEQLLREDVRASEDAVRKMVLVPVNENQFSAMVSLAYNLGAGGFSTATVLERINQWDYQGAADGFLIHDRARVNGELQSMPHLTERRQKERALFLTPA